MNQTGTSAKSYSKIKDRPGKIKVCDVDYKIEPAAVCAALFPEDQQRRLRQGRTRSNQANHCHTHYAHQHPRHTNPKTG